jgi:hypothetical protein
MAALRGTLVFVTTGLFLLLRFLAFLPSGVVGREASSVAVKGGGGVMCPAAYLMVDGVPAALWDVVDKIGETDVKHLYVPPSLVFLVVTRVGFLIGVRVLTVHFCATSKGEQICVM